ncbi:MAG: hypothetical protein ABJQ34_06830 [Paracoccaceae bacterium]
MKFFGTLIAVLCLFPAVASADRADQLLKGCKPILSAHKKSCEVEHVYDCGQRGFGYLTATGGKRSSVAFTDRDGDTGDFHRLDEALDITVESTQAKFSATQLLRTGKSTSETVIRIQTGALTERVNVVYKARLKKKRVSFAGYEFVTGKGDMKLTDLATGKKTSITYDLMISNPAGIHLTGRQTIKRARGTQTFNKSIQNIVGPGEAGFLSDKGQFGC